MMAMVTEKKDFSHMNLQTQHTLEERMRTLRAELAVKSPDFLGKNTGADFRDTGRVGNGIFQLWQWGNEIQVMYPSFGICGERSTYSIVDEALLLYYFSTADDSPRTGKWVSFRELPDGKIYEQAFQGYTGNSLASVFREKIEILRVAIKSLPATQKNLSEANQFEFTLFPRFQIRLQFWPGDDDFPPTYKMLFDTNACHYLPIDVCAIAGKALTSRIIKSAQDILNQAGMEEEII